jgi:hypothetical protein
VMQSEQCGTLLRMQFWGWSYWTSGFTGYSYNQFVFCLCERLGSLAVDYTPCVVDMAHSMLCQIINRPAEGINWDAKSETLCYISVLASIFQYILLW